MSRLITNEMRPTIGRILFGRAVTTPIFQRTPFIPNPIPFHRSTHSAVPTPLSAPQVQTTSTQQMKGKHMPYQPIPIEKVITATDYDDGVTLAEKIHTTRSASSFAETKIIDVLKSKAKYGDLLLSVQASDSVANALQTMNYYNIGAILVTSATDPKEIVGIFSTRDFIKQVDNDNWKPIDPKATKVEDVMSHDPVFTYSDTSALHSMNMMNSGGFRHLPVRDRLTNRTIGLISIGDLVRTMMKDYADKSSFLEDMVSGRYSS